MVYTSKKSSGKISWALPLVAVDEAIWIAGVAVAAGSRSLSLVGAGLAVTEIAISVAFPLLTWYEASVVNTNRFIRKILWPQIFAALLVIFLILFQGYWRAEYINGEIQLILVKNPAFYIALLFSVVSPLLNNLIIARMLIPSGYVRDFRQGAYWIACFFIAIVWLVIRFYFPGTYKYGCFVAFAVLLRSYIYNEHYRPAITSATNLADYIYYLAKIPLLLLAQDGKILLANNSALS
ncbi:MAG: hypothetical protein LBU16_09535, partial [Treponema sp.]|nr:hypothetical protein [Treponema sp.]